MDDLKRDAESLLTKTSLSDGVDRRDFLKVALGTGFAAAAMPVMAQNVIKTDTTGLTAGTITLTVDGQTVPVYRAQPEGKTNLPVVLVISEIFGVHEHIADVARRFAKLGYLALAPDLFVRQGDPQKSASIADLQRDIISKTPDTQVMADLDALVAWAKANGGNPDKIAITGFCWGGRVTWMYAAHNPSIKAGVAWYGRLEKPANTEFMGEEDRPWPMDIAASLTKPVLGLYADGDKGIPVASVQRMNDALAAARKTPSHIVLMEGTQHAFFADYRASYNKAAAETAWGSCLGWFGQYL